MDIQFKKGKTAVLCMDYQNDILASFPKESSILPAHAASTLKHARAQGAHVIHVAIGFRANYPEVSAGNKNFSALRQSGRFVTGTLGATIHAEVQPQANDITVFKHRVSAFAGSDLEMILRAQGIETVVLFGISTSGVVLSTLRQAADLDYQVVVIKDLCADSDEEVHRVLTEKIFPRQATMITAAEFAECSFTTT
jgi:nicotinamidase-related amidase